ncbi:rubredoxin family protein [Perilla frutescens var. frutescens]|nr:rubredoxin family protein [Perilla frutescens var. frutescens]
MSSAMAAGASSSYTAAFSRNLSLKTNSNHLHPQFQKTSFQGVSIEEAKRAVFNSLVLEGISNVRSVRKRGLEITARTAGAAKNIEVEVDKPLGLTLGQKQGGGVVITAVESGGNAARAGLKAGDQVLYTSSFFGDELWPADKLGFTKTAIQAKPDSVYFVVSRGVDVDVKRLPKRPAPPAFGRKLTDAQKARATHICLDCGYIYTLQKPFDEQPAEYACPQCRAPKKRFAVYDVKTGKASGGGLPIGVIIGLLVGVGGVGALLVYGLQ